MTEQSSPYLQDADDPMKPVRRIEDALLDRWPDWRSRWKADGWPSLATVARLAANAYEAVPNALSGEDAA